MTRRLSPKLVKLSIFSLLLILLIGGFAIFWENKSKSANNAKAQTIEHDVKVTAKVLPSNPTLGSTTIYIGSGNTPVVQVQNITVNDAIINLPITCTINYQSPSGQNITVTTTTQTLGECDYNPALPPEQQNAEILNGNASDITDTSGVGTVDISLQLGDTIKKLPKQKYKVSSLVKFEGGPSLNVQDLQPTLNLNSGFGASNPTDLVAKLNAYTGAIVIVALGVSSYLLIFFNILHSFRITKFRDFTEELYINLDISPKEIYTNEGVILTSKILDETDKEVSNLECILTMVTPQKEIIKILLKTNAEGVCGISISKNGEIDNQNETLEKLNLFPAKVVKGSLVGFNAVEGHGIVYIKAKVYSSRYHSRQITWSVRSPKI